MSAYLNPPREVVDAANFLLDNPQFNVLMKFGKQRAVDIMVGGSTDDAATNLIACQTWDYVLNLAHILSGEG